MSEIISEQEKSELIEYYKNKGLLIVGLNDLTGVPSFHIPFRKGLLEYLATYLTNERLTPKIIDAFSLSMNKTEHIDYFLKHNLSLEEIKLSQLYSVISAIEKIMTDIRLPKFLGQIGNIYQLIYTLKEGDEDVKITTSLQKAQEPIVIYASGINNLMREIGTTFFQARRDYKARNTIPNYYYTLDKINDPHTLSKVINGIEKNYHHLLSINPTVDIYTIKPSIPKSLQCEEMHSLKELITAYNESLLSLCKQYGVTFIDICSTSNDTLANYILRYIYQNKIVSSCPNYPKVTSKYKSTNEGASGVIDSITLDYKQSYQKAIQLSGYTKKRELAIAKEHQREAKIFRKVLTRKINRLINNPTDNYYP